MHRTMPDIDQEPMCLAPSSSPALVLVGLFVKLLYLYCKPKDTVIFIISKLRPNGVRSIMRVRAGTQSQAVWARTGSPGFRSSV